ncbi:MAG: hypothetical protein HYX75_08000 [Acidobacteria bacterium]|nr:hypothetical protein [Acidobacteriota bacterium]
MRQTICTITMILTAAALWGQEAMARAEDEGNGARLRTLFRPIETAARRYVGAENQRSSPELDIIAWKLRRKYGENLDSILQTVVPADGRPFSEEAGSRLKYVLVREYLHNLVQQRPAEIEPRGSPSRSTVRPLLVAMGVESGSPVALYYVPAAATNPYPIHWWVQISPDVKGGIGTDDAWWPYAVNGGNDFYRLDIEYIQNYTKYTVYLRDEDHPDPLTDASYDAWRLAYYGRIYDKESFTVQNGTITFGDIWSNGKTYAYPLGVHGSQTRPFAAGTAIYISNVWNHAMDTLDTNRNMSKTRWWIN